MVKSEIGCIEKLRHSKIKVHDPGTGKSAVLLNPKKVQARRIRIDHCLAPAGTKAADFLISMPQVVDVIVELKGKNVDHAVEQVESTHAFWKMHGEYERNQLISAWIICVQYPRASQKIKRSQDNFRAHDGILVVSTRNGEERPFSDFVPKLA
jgi:hypothetical protein